MPNGAIHTYTYDVMDRPVKTTFKENATSPEVQLYAFSYGKLANGHSQRTEVKFLNETETATTVSVYDFAGRLTEIQYPNGSKSKTEYNADGTVSKETATNGAITHYNYDGYGRLSEVYKPMSVENGGTKYSYTSYMYDKTGNKTEEKEGNELVLLGSLPITTVSRYFEYDTDARRLLLYIIKVGTYHIASCIDNGDVALSFPLPNLKRECVGFSLRFP